MAMKPVDAAIAIVVGPLIDDTDFKSAETAIAYDAAGLSISVVLERTDGTVVVTAVTPTGSTAGVYNWDHLGAGYYRLDMPANGGASYNNDAEGVLRVVGEATGVLPFSSIAYDVVSQQFYNATVAGSDKLEVDVTQWRGSTPAALADTDKVSTYVGNKGVLNDLAAGAAMTLTGDYDAAKTSAQAGDAMTLTGDYDAAKTSAQAGDLAVVDANVDELVAMTEDTTAGRKFTEKALEDAPTTAAADVATAILATPANKLATDVSGRVTVGSNADKSGYALTVTPPTAGDVATAILVTPANKLATDVSGRVTVGSNADKSGYALTVTPPTAADIKTAMEAAGSHLDELLDMTEDATGGRRFTEKALEEAPASSGGDATAANQTLILTALDDVKGTGFVKNTDSLVNLSANTPVQLTIESEVST